MTKYTLHKYNHNRSIKQNFEAIETILEAFDKATTNILGEIVGENFDFELVHYGINKAPVLATPLKGVAPLTERLSVFPITKKTGALFPPTSTRWVYTL